MNDTADPSSRRHRFTPRGPFSFAIIVLSVSLVPAYVGSVGIATVGETEAPTHVEPTEAVADRKGEHEQRRRTVSQRMRWRQHLLATKRDEARRHWHRRQGESLPPSPCHTLAATRAPPTVR
jgi:hypothetical protein